MASLPNLATTFTCFPKLPAELRLKIWRLCPIRVLRINCAIREQTQQDSGFTCQYSTYRSGHGMPATFSVSRESRQCALKSYIIIRDHFGPCFYFNPFLDTLDVSTLSVEDWLPMVEKMSRAFPCRQVRSLAISQHSLSPASNKVMGSKRLMLEELFIVVGESLASPRKDPTCPETIPVADIVRGDTTPLYPDGKSTPGWLSEDGLFKMLKYDDASEFPAGRVPTVKAVSADFWEPLSQWLQLYW